MASTEFNIRKVTEMASTEFNASNSQTDGMLWLAREFCYVTTANVNKLLVSISNRKFQDSQMSHCDINIFKRPDATL